MPTVLLFVAQFCAAVCGVPPPVGANSLNTTLPPPLDQVSDEWREELEVLETLSTSALLQVARERLTVADDNFFREGRAGQWKEVLTQAQVDRIVRDHGEQMARFGYLPLG